MISALLGNFKTQLDRIIANNASLELTLTTQASKHVLIVQKVDSAHPLATCLEIMKLALQVHIII